MVLRLYEKVYLGYPRKLDMNKSEVNVKVQMKSGDVNVLKVFQDKHLYKYQSFVAFDVIRNGPFRLTRRKDRPMDGPITTYALDLHQ